MLSGSCSSSPFFSFHCLIITTFYSKTSATMNGNMEQKDSGSGTGGTITPESTLI